MKIFIFLLFCAVFFFHLPYGTKDSIRFLLIYIYTFKNNGQTEPGVSGGGFEFYSPSRFLVDGDTFDFYGEAFKKYRKFFELDATVNKGVPVTIPSFSTAMFGITLGV